jgi:hypothetical protein
MWDGIAAPEGLEACNPDQREGRPFERRPALRQPIHATKWQIRANLRSGPRLPGVTGGASRRQDHSLRPVELIPADRCVDSKVISAGSMRHDSFSSVLDETWNGG